MVDPELVPSPVLGRPLLRLDQLATGVEKRPLGDAEAGASVVAPVEGVGQADAAVQLALGAAHRLPGVGGHGQVTQDALAFDVVVEPAPQARPGAGHRLVRELHHSVVARHQPRADEQLR